MSKVLVSEENLTNIANAIREKNESTDSYKPGEMAEAIQNIQSGDPELEASFFSVINYNNDNVWECDLGGSCTKLPSGLKGIRSYTFYDCVHLALTELPSGITYIGDSAFYGCREFVLTELPSGLTNIGSKAFYGCTHLALTKLPSGIKYIGYSAFDSCENLALTELPSGITNINRDSFYKCANIEKLIVNSTELYKIDYNAFSSCSKLSTLAFPNVTSVPTIPNTGVFASTPIKSGTGYIYVPDTLVDSFKTATNWSTYADQIKPISELEVSA